MVNISRLNGSIVQLIVCELDALLKVVVSKVNEIEHFGNFFFTCTAWVFVDIAFENLDGERVSIGIIRIAIHNTVVVLDLAELWTKPLEVNVLLKLTNLEAVRLKIFKSALPEFCNLVLAFALNSSPYI